MDCNIFTMRKAIAQAGGDKGGLGMIQLYDGGAYLVNGTDIVPEQDAAKLRQLTGRTVSKEEGRKGTIAYSILKNHNTSGSMEHLKIKFDAMASHDITFVGIIQTAKHREWKNSPFPTC